MQPLKLAPIGGCGVVWLGWRMAAILLHVKRCSLENCPVRVRVGARGPRTRVQPRTLHIGGWQFVALQRGEEVYKQVGRNIGRCDLQSLRHSYMVKSNQSSFPNYQVQVNKVINSAVDLPRMSLGCFYESALGQLGSLQLWSMRNTLIRALPTIICGYALIFMFVFHHVLPIRIFWRNRLWRSSNCSECMV